MKRPKLRKGSKRLSCSKRYKIQKRVKEHKRKVKKEAKKSPGKKTKRDISVPNDAPFKMEILKEAELRRQRREELKNNQKMERQKEVAKKRQMEKKKEKPTKNKKADVRGSAHTENSQMLFCRQVNKVIEECDVVLEVLDARDPMGCRCPQVETFVLQHPNKKVLLLLNKADLVPKDNLEKWLQVLNDELPALPFKCRTEKKDPKKGKADLGKGTGGEALLKILHSLCPSPSEGVKVGVIGFANVGKSSVINTMKRSLACNVGATKGTTRVAQEVWVDSEIKMVDSPALVVSPHNPPITVTMRSSCEGEEDDVLGAVDVILRHASKQQMMMNYTLPGYTTSLEFLTLLANKRGMLKKGGVADTNKAARLLLGDWAGTKLKYHCPPPESPIIPNGVTRQTQKWVNRELVEKENHCTMNEFRGSGPTSSIVFTSPGPTNGIVDEKEIADRPVEESDRRHEEEISTDPIGPSAVKDEGPESKGRSVHFDKTEDDDTYDFNTDFV